MKDGLGSQPDAVVKFSGPLDDRRLHDIVDERDQRKGESPQDVGSRNAVRQKIIELGADLQEACDAAIRNHLLCNLVDEHLPVGNGDSGAVRDLFTLELLALKMGEQFGRQDLLGRINRLEHHLGSAQVAVTRLREALVQAAQGRPALLLCRVGQHSANLLMGGSAHANQEGARLDWCNDVGSRVRQENEPQVGRVFFHRATQGCLRIAGEVFGFVDDHDLELLLSRRIDLLRLRNLLEDVLDDDAVIVADVRGGDLEMVERGNNVELQLPVAACLEDTGIDLDFFYSGAEELLQRRNDSSLLAGAGWSVDKDMREIARLGL